MSGLDSGQTRPPDKDTVVSSGRQTMSQERSADSSCASASSAVTQKEVVLTFQDVGLSPSAPLMMSEVADVLVNKLGFPPKEILAIDMGPRLKVIVWVTPTCRVEAYSSINAMFVKPGLGMLPMKCLDREVWVKVYWTNLNDSSAELTNVLSNFGIPTSSMSMIPLGPSKDPLMNKLSHVVEPNRQIKMKLFKSVPNYIMLGDKRVFVKHPGQIRYCARCYREKSKCPGNGDAKKCETENGPKRLLKNVWDEVKDEAPALNVSRDLDCDYLEFSGFKDEPKDNVWNWIREVSGVDFSKSILIKNVSSGVNRVPVGGGQKLTKDEALAIVKECNQRKRKSEFISALPYSGDWEEDHDDPTEESDEIEIIEQDPEENGKDTEKKDKGDEGEGSGSSGGSGGGASGSGAKPKKGGEKDQEEGGGDQGDQGKDKEGAGNPLAGGGQAKSIYQFKTPVIDLSDSNVVLDYDTGHFVQESVLKDRDMIQGWLGSSSSSSSEEIVSAVGESPTLNPGVRPETIGSESDEVFDDSTKNLPKDLVARKSKVGCNSTAITEENRRKMDEFYRCRKKHARMPDAATPAVRRSQSILMNQVENNQKRKAQRQSPSPGTSGIPKKLAKKGKMMAGKKNLQRVKQKNIMKDFTLNEAADDDDFIPQPVINYNTPRNVKIVKPKTSKKLDVAMSKPSSSCP